GRELARVLSALRDLRDRAPRPVRGEPMIRDARSVAIAEIHVPALPMPAEEMDHQNCQTNSPVEPGHDPDTPASGTPHPVAAPVAQLPGAPAAEPGTLNCETTSPAERRETVGG